MIETLDDWNVRLGYCGCCEMPACPSPTIIHNKKPETFSGSCGFNIWDESFAIAGLPGCSDWRSTGGSLVVHITTDDGADVTETFTKSRPTPGECDLVRTGTSINVFGELISETYAAGVFTRVYDYKIGGTSIREYTVTRTYTPFRTEADNLAEMKADSDLQITAASWGSGGTGARRSYSAFPVTSSNAACMVNPYLPSAVQITPYRFRFQIPITHLGTYFKITYDIAEFPTDPLTPDSFVSEDNVIEWTGPGDPEDAEAASWLTDWIELAPPDEPGERRVVNIRYTCYQGTKYGVKPQTTGESFTPSTP
jgi:hypothetical protein